MKKLIILNLLLFITFAAFGQESKYPKLDVSIMDTEYYPQEVAWRNYLGDDQRDLQPKVKVVYSKPLKKDRVIFGNLVPYGKEWRLGANEATQITFYQPVRIGDKTVPAGVYTAFADVESNAWTFHISSESGIWGEVNRDKSKTVASLRVPSKMSDKSMESLSMTFQEVDDMHVNLVVQWDKTFAALPISFDPISFSPMDKSPMDIAHYPGNSAFTNYLEGEEKNLKPKIQVTYSRPYKNGRDVFGSMLKKGNIWRIGANEATEIVFYENVKIGDLELAKGRYTMFAELQEGFWEIIFSKDLPIWGEANRDLTKDVGRAKAMITTESEVVENLAIIFDEKSTSEVHMIIAWDKTRVAVPVTFK